MRLRILTLRPSNACASPAGTVSSMPIFSTDRTAFAPKIVLLEPSSILNCIVPQIGQSLSGLGILISAWTNFIGPVRLFFNIRYA